MTTMPNNSRRHQNDIIILRKYILKTISNANVSYHKATEKVKKLYIKHISKFEKSEYLKKAISILDKIQLVKINVEKQYNDNEKEFQGNLDPQKIDKLLETYGIETTIIKMLQMATERTSIRNIAIWRNDLAHGKYSFAEFGRNKLRYKTSDRRDKQNDILFMKDSCFLFLEIMLSNVEDYINNSSFKL